MSKKTPNLVSEFEKRYSALSATLTASDERHDKGKETLKQEEENIHKFMETARSLETYFLRKRQLLYAHKPELLVKEDTIELKQELARKDELLKKHSEKLKDWKEMLKDIQEIPPPPQQQQAHPPPMMPRPPVGYVGVAGPPAAGMMGGPPYGPPRMPPGGMMPQPPMNR